ncbi:hypothetical protein M408DRAFT_229202 [Serendipita vermifera MAFF 305830]|uniref:Uncharacterized protein n=1 Tax=Serendipita vermifera MAFF 305830 TaxID=933852 RepID=A0A0C3AJK9_SERVB|nr:hypothetical protein M408DRAFT_229202 [Serendipita vermifera MAFF 305830]
MQLTYRRAIGLTTLVFWLLLAVAIWQFHPSSIATIVPFHHIPWMPSLNFGSSYGKRPRPPLSDGSWIRSFERMNDTLVWDIKRGCLEPSSLTPGHTRSMDVDAWEWILADGSRLTEFDIECFVIRALQSRIGFVLVGDSLTEHITAALEMMLLMPHPPQQPRLITREYEWGWTRWSKQTNPTIFSNNMTLSRHHPLTQRIMARWESGDEELKNIPLERLSRPIVRMFRSSNLASEEEISEVIEHDMGTPVNWTETLRIPTPWREHLKRHIEEPGWEGEKPSIVLISTGPHWEPARFGRAVTESQMKQAYELVMRKVYDSFLSFPSDLPIRVMYRSTMPGHEYCTRYHYPVTLFDDIAKDPTPSKNHYHYHWFPKYNAFAKGLWDEGPLSLSRNRMQEVDIDILKSRGGPAKREPEASVATEYWDVWNMTVTRPDAHVGNNGRDCLHFCPAGVYYWVVRAWWDTIVINGY